VPTVFCILLQPKTPSSPSKAKYYNKLETASLK
jgi:hypothetical protein